MLQSLYTPPVTTGTAGRIHDGIEDGFHRTGTYDRLTTFLHDPKVDGTNNAAERASRRPVVMRKITGGSRSAVGARAWAIQASVMRTTQQQGRDVLETLRSLLRAAWAGKTAAILANSP